MFGVRSGTEKVALKRLPITYSVAMVVIGSGEVAAWVFGEYRNTLDAVD